jgi:hypothetical protein
LRGNFALRVPAHAIGKNEYPGGTRVAVSHAIFVFRAATLPTQLEDRKFHWSFLPMPVAF